MCYFHNLYLSSFLCQDREQIWEDTLCKGKESTGIFSLPACPKYYTGREGADLLAGQENPTSRYIISWAKTAVVNARKEPKVA